MIELANVVAADSETHPIQDGLLAPPGVCWSFADDTPGSECVVPFDAGLRQFERLLVSNAVIAGANIAYDMAVAAAEPEGGRWKGNGELLPLIFAKYDRGEVFDVLIAIALDAVADGLLFKDPITGMDLRHPPTADQLARGKQGKIAKRYSLEISTRILTGRENAKVNDDYRTRYHELEWSPISEWPEVARQYPKDDARNTWDCAAALISKGKNLGYVKAPGLKERVTHQTFEARSAFAMHLACVYGMRTDGEHVEKLADEIEIKYADALERFKDSGIIRTEGPKAGTKDTSTLKRLVIKAYGGEAPCATCTGSGKVPSPVRPKNKINCKSCGGSGLIYPPSLPLTDGGGPSTARDTLAESGNDVLEEFAGVSETVKLRGTYIPFLKTGVHRPISLRSNPLVESGRASYDGLIQLLPRGHGIREAFKAREGRVYCSTDYSAIELCTLAQCCLWVVGWSKMAEAINASKDPGVLHTILGARLLGKDPEEFKRLVKAGDKDAKNGRFNAKAANFGFPGFMGPAKLTLAKRKEGIRFCITSGRAPKCPACDGREKLKCRLCYGRGYICGVEKVTEWKGRPIPPTCVTCIEYATELRNMWFEQWPEVTEYFEWVKSHAGVEDSQAVLESLGSGYVRGGLHASNLANHGFQHLASRGAKHALYHLSRERYTVRSSPLYVAEASPIVFAHDEVITEPLLCDVTHEAAYRQAAVMVERMREFVPDVHVACDPALMLRWYKDAEPVKDANGRLIPWEPKRKAA
jgi:DNA polymerase-1